MRGLNKFKRAFKVHKQCMIVIGGTACEDYFEDQGLKFRATSEIDIILVVELISDAFLNDFWKFIQEGGYEVWQSEEGEKRFYRFMKPKTDDYPAQIELFSRKPDTLILPDTFKYTPIPATESAPSLSAILMNEEYYAFVRQHSYQGDAIVRASELSLIVLKAKAYLDLRSSKEEGQAIDSKVIKKHRSDVFKLAATLTDEHTIEVPDSINTDLIDFVSILKDEQPDIKGILKSMGISTRISSAELLHQIEVVYRLG